MRPNPIIQRTTRRKLILKSGVIFLSSIVAAKARVAQDEPVFLYCRSGKITHLSADGVLLSGLLASKKSLDRLEADLKVAAESAKLHIPLRYSTSKIYPPCTEKFLQVLSTHETHFLGLMVRAPEWAATPQNFEYWRTALEAKALRKLSPQNAVEIHSLRHDKKIDDRILTEIEKQSNAKYTLYDSIKKSSRAFQLATVIAKSIVGYSGTSIPESAAKKIQIAAVANHYALGNEIWPTEKTGISLSYLDV